MSASTWTTADLEAVRDLKRKWISDNEGAKTIQFGDRSVTFRSFDELDRFEDQILRALRTRSKQTRGHASKGY